MVKDKEKCLSEKGILLISIIVRRKFNNEVLY